jgi:hypothetical protein
MSMDETVKELHRDLKGRFQRHGTRLEQIWRSLNQEQRTKILKDGAHEGKVLKNSSDTSMGNVYKFIPEWNLHDITTPSSDYLLDILKHRATTSLQTQYKSGAKGGPGDHAYIVGMMQRKNLKLTHASELKNCYTLFIDEETYGQSMKIKAEKSEVLAAMKPAMEAQLIVPQATGDLILMRQTYLLQALNIVIEDILDTASNTRARDERPKKPAGVGTGALAKLSVHARPRKLELSDLVESSLDQKSSLEDSLQIISTEPTVLAHEVNLCFFTRPELIADEKGRIMPVHTDKYISGAVFEVIHGNVKTAAVWNYISQLLALLKNLPDKQFRAIVLQELSNTCQLEYTRARAMFKRNVSAGGSGGNKWFKRMSTVQKDGSVRISMKGKPESLTATNPQLHYILRLCQDETNWSKSAEWLQKLESLHRAHPLEQEKMTEQEFYALGELAIIVTFLQSLSSVAQLPTVSNKKGQMFVSGYLALENELRPVKDGADLSDFAIPIDNLLEPNMATGALTALDEYISEKTGTKLGILYQDLVDKCVCDIHEQYEQHKAKVKEDTAKPEYVVPTAPEARHTPESWIQQHRQKEKTRPAHSSIYEITPQVTPAAPIAEEEPAQPRQTFNVKPSTFAVFATLLSRSSAPRGSVTWDAFAAAMVDLGFSVIPKMGSIYTFVPPDKVAVQRGITLHRPHQSSIEWPRLLVYSRRLQRVYGWDDTTFVMS